MTRPEHQDILQIGTRYLWPVLILISVLVLYRGHNLPGGGFIGGLLAASAIILWALGDGWEYVESRLPMSPLVSMALGLLIAALSGLPALLNSEAYMTGAWLPFFELPVVGKVKLGTPLLFDIGVYLTVIGFTLKCAITLSENELDEHSVAPPLSEPSVSEAKAPEAANKSPQTVKEGAAWKSSSQH